MATDPNTLIIPEYERRLSAAASANDQSEIDLIQAEYHKERKAKVTPKSKAKTEKSKTEKKNNTPASTSPDTRPKA